MPPCTWLSFRASDMNYNPLGTFGLACSRWLG